ncbi:hypothetical protein [Pseudoduganella violaceinigra]|uniref:hypothetical protein n=1 Tax=Pseudoduganella violaceinigra TaxID=246602 RepID=UPI0012B523A6|nr:hypothetical protein [Pseudoduganella violaceinigra]
MYLDEEEFAEVITYLNKDKEALSPVHRVALGTALIAPIKLNVDDSSGEFVVAVAAFGGNLLYWSDIEESWKFANVGNQGKMSTRGCDQFELCHVMIHLVRGSCAV